MHQVPDESTRGEHLNVPREPKLGWYESLRRYNIRIYRTRNIFCTFCKKNGELPPVYKSHFLKDYVGTLTCPILRSMRCPICNATDGEAHTRKYCPMNRRTIRADGRVIACRPGVSAMPDAPRSQPHRLQPRPPVFGPPTLAVLPDDRLLDINRYFEGIHEENTRKYGAQPFCCNFCRKNGEFHIVFESHPLRDHYGVLTCPILRRYVCPICSATGDAAHTAQYCPANPRRQQVFLHYA